MTGRDACDRAAAQPARLTPQPRTLLRAGAGVLVTAALVILLLALADWRAVAAAAADLSPAVIVGVTLLMALTQLARAVRLGLMLQKAVVGSFFPLLRVTVLHNFFSMYAPMRIGELALIWLVKREFGFGLSASVGVFVFVRSLDALFLLGSAGVAAWFVVPTNGPFSWLRPLGLVGAAAAALALLAWAAGGAQFLDRIGRGWEGSDNRFLLALARAARVATAMEPRRAARIFMATAAGWACIFAAASYAAAAVLPGAGLAIAVWAADGGGLSFALPVTGVANLGSYEAATVAALSLARVSYEDALLLAILLHAAILLAPLTLLPLTLLGRRPPEPVE